MGCLLRYFPEESSLAAPDRVSNVRPKKQCNLGVQLGETVSLLKEACVRAACRSMAVSGSCSMEKLTSTRGIHDNCITGPCTLAGSYTTEEFLHKFKASLVGLHSELQTNLGLYSETSSKQTNNNKKKRKGKRPQTNFL